MPLSRQRGDSFPRCPWPTRGSRAVCRLIFDKQRFLVVLSELSRQTFASAAFNCLLAFHNTRLIDIRDTYTRWSTENLFTTYKLVLDVVVVVRHSPSAFHATKQSGKHKFEDLDRVQLVLPWIYTYDFFDDFDFSVSIDIHRLYVSV